jgi:hypothetical protein
MRIVVVSVVLALGAIGCGSGGSGTSGNAATAEEVEHFARMSVDEVAAGMAAADRRLAVFDANDRETFDERHVPGATWVDYDGVTREQLPSDTSTPLVFYCYNEAPARRATSLRRAPSRWASRACPSWAPASPAGWRQGSPWRDPPLRPRRRPRRSDFAASALTPQRRMYVAKRMAWGWASSLGWRSSKTSVHASRSMRGNDASPSTSASTCVSSSLVARGRNAR